MFLKAATGTCELSSKCRGKENSSSALGVPSLGVTSEKGQKKPWQWAPETSLVKKTLPKWSEKNRKVSQGSYCVQSTWEQLAEPSRKTHFVARVQNPLEVRGVLPRSGDYPERVFPALLYSSDIIDLPKWSVIRGLKPLQHLGRKGEKPNIDYWLAYLSQLAKGSLYLYHMKVLPSCGRHFPQLS